jgi:hypothetical protein
MEWNFPASVHPNQVPMLQNFLKGLQFMNVHHKLACLSLARLTSQVKCFWMS